MLVAYLRGLLKPTLPNAISSRLREELILKSLSIELSNTLDMHENLVWSSVATNPSQNFIGNLKLSLENIQEKLEYSRENAKKRLLERANLSDLYNILQKKGILEQISKDKECKSLIIHH